MTDYKSRSGVPYEAPMRMGYTSLDILHFLWGQPWDELALNFVHSIHPSFIRVIPNNGEETTDARHGRVTIYLCEDGQRIEHVEQECEVGLTGFLNGHELMLEARRRGIKFAGWYK